MRLVFEVDGDRLIERDLLRLGEYAQDATPAFEAIGGLMMEETKDQFATEGRHASGGWRPLAPSTVRRKLHGGRFTRGFAIGPGGGNFVAVSSGGLGILYETGALERSLTDRDAPNQIFEAAPQELVFGSSLPYARYHQRGTHRMPQRRPLEFTEPAKRRMVKILQRWIVTGEVAA